MVIRPTSNELQEKAKNVINEVPNRISEDLEKVREWISKQTHLNCRSDDQWLLTFLRGCKFSLERTKEKLDSYYTIRTLVPEYGRNRDPLESKVQEILKAGILLPLPQTLDDTGPRIILCQYENCNPTTMPMETLIKAFFMLLDILLLEDDNFTISGALFWVDFKLFPLSYIFQMTPTVVKKSFSLLQHAYPARINGIHFTNTPSAFEQIFNIIMSLATPKLKERMRLYSVSNTDNFYKTLPQKYMPKEYGGENGSVSELTAHWKKKFEDHRKWFLEDENYGTDEKLRAKPMTSADLFGVEGSFRALTVD